MNVIMCFMLVSSVQTAHSEVGHELALPPRSEHYTTVPERASGFLHTYALHSRDHLMDEIYDSLNPLSLQFDFALNEEDDYLSLSDFGRALNRGAREMATSTALIENTEDYLHDFIVGSIGSVEEEKIKPTNLLPQYAEQSWWKKVRNNGVLRYGIRPFRTSPYAYLSMKVKDDDGSELFLFHLRYRFKSLESHKAEALFAIPLRYGWELNTGFEYSSSKRDEERGEKFVWTIGMEKRLSKENAYNTFFVAANVNRDSEIKTGFRQSW